MAINLNKYRDSLSSAWKDVLDDKTSTNWVLCGYEGQTNDLKVVSKGSGGLEEMIEDLNSGKVMYAFVKVEDTTTSLNKSILINWQGEGANTVRKGLCANHLRDIEKFFTGAHLTINARNEEEVEPQFIIEKLAKAGSAYSFKAPRGDTTGPAKAIGSNYQRVNPVKEINARERDQFWQKEEQEEKLRVEEERKRKETDKVKRDEEVKQREIAGSLERDAKSAVRNNKIAQQKEAEKVAFESLKRQESDTFADDRETKVNQGDLLRQQRNQEAQQLIAQRTIDARSVFEQNTAISQMKRAPEKPIRHSILKAHTYPSNTIENKPEIVPVVETKVEEPPVVVQTKIIDEQPSDDDSDQFSTIKRCPRDTEKKIDSTPQQQEIIKNNINKQDPPSYQEQPVLQITDQQFVDEVIYQDFSEGPGLQARALYDYQAADDTEITFDPGDIITNIDQVDEGWWQGLGPDGTYGLFPANYVELMQ